MGFFQTKYTLGRDDHGRILLDKFPSRAPRQPSITDWGTQADSADGVLLNVEGMTYFVGPGVMDVVNDRSSRQVNDGFVTRPEYKAFLLGVCYRVAARYAVQETLEIEHAVFGLPVASLGANRGEVRKLALGRHVVPRWDGRGTVQVIIRNVYVVAQPQGAVAAVQEEEPHGAQATSHITQETGQTPLVETSGVLTDRPKAAPQTCLITDMGGGTFDWLVSTGMRLHQGRAGSVDMGTLACVEAALKKVRPDLVRDIPANLIMDRALRMKEPVVVLAGKPYQMDGCWAAVRSVLRDATEEMLSSVKSWGDISRILVTGGGGPLLLDALKTLMPDRAHLMFLINDPVMANVRGFHILAETQAELSRITAEAK